jgi:hypothetical protein
VTSKDSLPQRFDLDPLSKTSLQCAPPPKKSRKKALAGCD